MTKHGKIKGKARTCAGHILCAFARFYRFKEYVDEYIKLSQPREGNEDACKELLNDIKNQYLIASRLSNALFPIIATSTTPDTPTIVLKDGAGEIY